MDKLDDIRDGKLVQTFNKRIKHPFVIFAAKTNWNIDIFQVFFLLQSFSEW